MGCSIPMAPPVDGCMEIGCSVHFHHCCQMEWEMAQYRHDDPEGDFGDCKYESRGSVGNVADVVSAKLSQNADMATCRRHVGTCRPDMSATCGLLCPFCPTTLSATCRHVADICRRLNDVVSVVGYTVYQQSCVPGSEPRTGHS